MQAEDRPGGHAADGTTAARSNTVRDASGTEHLSRNARGPHVSGQTPHGRAQTDKFGARHPICAAPAARDEPHRRRARAGAYPRGPRARLPQRGVCAPRIAADLLHMVESSLEGWDSARLRALVMNVPGAIYRCSPSHDWAMEFISDEVESISGHPASEYVNNNVRTFASVICPDDRTAVEDAVGAALDRGEPFEVEYRITHRDGSIRWVYERGQGILGPDGEVAFLDGVICDITDRKQAEEQLAFLAYHDSLTGLPNRLLFQEHLEVALRAADRDGTNVAVLFIDLDGFKLVNDSFGHAAGDDLLVEVARARSGTSSATRTWSPARAATSSWSSSPTSPARPSTSGRGRRRDAARRWTSTRRCSGRSRSPAPRSSVNASIGISIFPDDAPDAEYAAQARRHRDVPGQGARPRRPRALRQRRQRPAPPAVLATRLGSAITDGDLLLHYQPLVELATGAVVGAEALRALARRRPRPDRPGEFIPIAERTGPDRAAQRLGDRPGLPADGRLERAGLDLYVSVNLPAVLWPTRPRRAARRPMRARSGLRPNRLMMEITESAMMPTAAPRRRSSPSCTGAACGSPSTTSAPATRRSAASRRCSSTR